MEQETGILRLGLRGVWEYAEADQAEAAYALALAAMAWANPCCEEYLLRSWLDSWRGRELAVQVIDDITHGAEVRESLRRRVKRLTAPAPEGWVEG